jgi:hypothetical protein
MAAALPKLIFGKKKQAAPTVASGDKPSGPIVTDLAADSPLRRRRGRSEGGGRAGRGLGLSPIQTLLSDKLGA